MTIARRIAAPLGIVALGAALLALPAFGQDEAPAETEANTAFDESDGPYPWPDFAGVQPQPGQYRAITRITAFDMTGLPEMEGVDMEEMMQDMDPQEQLFCVAAGEELPSWSDQFAEEGCTAGEPVLGDGGTFAVTLSCGPAADGLETVRAQGSVTPTSSAMTIDIDGAAGEVGRLQMQFTSEATRIGDCPA